MKRISRVGSKTASYYSGALFYISVYNQSSLPRVSVPGDECLY